MQLARVASRIVV